MAKLPSALDLQRRPAPSESPGINVASIDYSPMAKGANAIGEGMQAIGKGVSAYLKAGEEVDDYETKKKLLDFKLNSEMALEDAKRDMLPGGGNFAESWQKTYEKQAKQFVGKDDSAIPQSQRAKVGLLLKQHEVALSERAQRYELTERDKAGIESLELTLGKTRDFVATRPEERDKWLSEGHGVIDQSRLPITTKYEYKKKFTREVDKAYGESLINSIQSADDLEKVRDLIAPTAPDRRAEKAALRGVPVKAGPDGRIDPVQFAARMEEKVAESDLAGTVPPWGARFGIKTGSPREWARFFTMVQQQESGHRVAPTNPDGSLRRFPTTPGGERSFGPGQFNVGEYGLKTWADVNDPEKVADAYIQVAKQGKVTQYFGSVQRPNETLQHASWYEKNIAPALDAGTQAANDNPDAYRGPMQSLSLDERRGMWGRAEARFAKQIQDTAEVLKKYEAGAAQGKLPPDDQLSVIESRVRQLKDPLLQAQYVSMMQAAEITAQTKRMPPLVQDEIIRRMEEATRDTATPEQLKAIDHRKKLRESTQKESDADPMTWAHTAGIEVPVGIANPNDIESQAWAQGGIPKQRVNLERLDLNNPDMLVRRIDQAKAVGAYLGQPPQIFTSKERKFLQDDLASGGDRMLHTLGMITTAARERGVEPLSMMKEFVKGDGEVSDVAMVGRMVAEGASPQLLADAAAAMQIKHKEGANYVNQIEKLQAKADMSEMAPIFARMAGAKTPIERITNLIYNHRHVTSQKTTFDNELYKKTLREVMGERTIDNIAFGGIGNQGTGFDDGKWSSGWASTPKVLVPRSVRQDSFDDLVGAIREDDLSIVGKPVYGDGKPLTAAAIRQADWVSVAGEGRYLLRLGVKADGEEQFAYDPQTNKPFVLDVKPIMPRLQERKPEIFYGYQGKVDFKAPEQQMRRNPEAGTPSWQRTYENLNMKRN